MAWNFINYVLVGGLGALLIGGLGRFFISGKKDSLNVLAVLGLLAFGGAWFFGGTQGLMAAGGAGGITIPGTPTTTTADCPDVAVTGSTSVRNIANVTENYLANSLVWTKADGKTYIASGTATGGPARADVSTTIICTNDIYKDGVYVFAKASGTLSSAKSPLLKFDGSNAVQTLLNAYAYVNLSTYTLDSSYANTSSKETDLQLSLVTQTAATAIAQGQTVTGFIDMKESTSNSAYGSPHTGTLFAIDSVDNAITSNDINLAVVSGNYQLTQIACSTYKNGAAKYSADKCYIGPAITSNIGLVRMSYTIGSSSGDASNDPIIYMHPVEYGTDTDGSMILDTHDSGGTVFGVTAAGTKLVTINLS